MAFFLVGDQAQAERLVEATYEKAWREHVAGRRIENWRLHLLRALSQEFNLAGIHPQRVQTPPLWEALSKLECESRFIILLDALDVPVKHIAWIVNSPEELAAQRLKAVREDFGKHCPAEIN
jgi:hypothetical protein